MTRLATLALSAVLFAAVAASAQDTARMDQVIQSHVSAGTFMGTVLVARDGAVIVDKAYGMANVEWDIPNTPATKFRLGSITKQFTAAAILLLEERGKLKADDRVKSYLPDSPMAWDRITIFNLLTHTAGIPNFTSSADYNTIKLSARSADAAVTSFRDRPLDFGPGEQMSYSNSGYLVLGAIIEKVSGQTYEKFVADNLFAPAGMTDSGYDSNSAIIKRRASGYLPTPAGFTNAGYLHMSIPARGRRPVFDDARPVEVGAGVVCGPDRVEGLARSDDHAVQERLRAGPDLGARQRPPRHRARRRHRRLQYAPGVLSGLTDGRDRVVEREWHGAGHAGRAARRPHAWRQCDVDDGTQGDHRAGRHARQVCRRVRTGTQRGDDDHPRRRRLDGAAQRPGPRRDLPAIRDAVFPEVGTRSSSLPPTAARWCCTRMAAARRPRGADAHEPGRRWKGPPQDGPSLRLSFNRGRGGRRGQRADP